MAFFQEREREQWRMRDKKEGKSTIQIEWMRSFFSLYIAGLADRMLQLFFEMFHNIEERRTNWIESSSACNYIRGSWNEKRERKL